MLYNFDLVYSVIFRVLRNIDSRLEIFLRMNKTKILGKINFVQNHWLERFIIFMLYNKFCYSVCKNVVILTSEISFRFIEIVFDVNHRHWCIQDNCRLNNHSFQINIKQFAWFDFICSLKTKHIFCVITTKWVV